MRKKRVSWAWNWGKKRNAMNVDHILITAPLEVLLLYELSQLCFPGGSVVKNPPTKAGDMGLIPGLGICPGEGHDNPLHYFCLVNPHGQRSWVGYSPAGCKKLDTTERLNSNITIRLQNILACLPPDPLLCQTNHQLCCGHSTKGASPLCFGFSNSSQGPGQMIRVGAVCHHLKTSLCLKQNSSSTFSTKHSPIQPCQQMLTGPYYVYALPW